MGNAPSSTSSTPPSSPRPATSTRSFSRMRRWAAKDNICTVEMSSMVGSRVLEGYTLPYDATIVKKIKELSGIVVVKTNLGLWSARPIWMSLEWAAPPKAPPFRFWLFWVLSKFRSFQIY
ncbi:hypothetical protein ACLB2K_007140 [Fragaria x ananassa]